MPEQLPLTESSLDIASAERQFQHAVQSFNGATTELEHQKAVAEMNRTRTVLINLGYSLEALCKLVDEV